MNSKESILIKGSEYLHIRKAAQLLNLSQPTVRIGCRDGSLRAVQVGGAWYVEKTSLRLFLKKTQGKSASKSVDTRITRSSERKEIERRLKNVGRLFTVGGEIRKRRA